MYKFKALDINGKSHQIKVYSIRKEFWQDGQCEICECCGKSIRHIMVIDGNAYGQTCGAKKLGWSETTNAAIQRKSERRDADPRIFQKESQYFKSVLAKSQYLAIAEAHPIF